MGDHYFRPIVLALCLIVFTFGCSGSDESSDGGDINFGDTNLGDINLSGAWEGYGGDASDTADREGYFTLDLNQSGASVSGSATAKDINLETVWSGSISGIMVDDVLTFTMSFSSSGCTVRINGLADVTDSTISADYDGTNSCRGSFDDGILSLTRQ